MFSFDTQINVKNNRAHTHTVSHLVDRVIANEDCWEQENLYEKITQIIINGLNRNHIIKHIKIIIMINVIKTTGNFTSNFDK